MEQPSDQYQPFFVVGPLRSGTTLLRLLIDHHPEINCFGELECAVSQAEGNSWPDIADFKRFVAIDRQTSNYNFAVDDKLEYVELVKSFMDQMHARNPQPLVGASIHSRMDLLPEIWPNAKYIKLFRDPRDVARSCIGMGWVGNVYKGADYWVEPEEHWEILKQKADGKTLAVWYEELVSNPEAELSRIASFLECEYSPKMLELEHDTSYSRPDSKYANQWQNKLTTRQIELVESKCAELMVSRKYEISSANIKSPGFAEKAYLTLQNRFYRVSSNIKEYGFSNWFLFVLSKKLGLRDLYEKKQRVINEIRKKSLH